MAEADGRRGSPLVTPSVGRGPGSMKAAVYSVANDNTNSGSVGCSGTSRWRLKISMLVIASVIGSLATSIEQP